MKQLHLVFILLTMTIISISSKAFSSSFDVIFPTIDVKLETQQSGKHFLSIDLINKTGGDFTIVKSDLPWEAPINFITVSVELDNMNKYLDEYSYIYDPPVEQNILTISNGKSLRGKISIESRFPFIQKSLKRSDLLLFWSYKMFLPYSPNTKRYGGWLIIPKISNNKD